MAKKFKRIRSYVPPPSRAFQELLDAERASIRSGDTAGLDPEKSYLAVRIARGRELLWKVAVSPFDPQSDDDDVLFVASITLGTAVYLVREGAEVVEQDL